MLSQKKNVEGVEDKRDFRIMFYNVENLFDIYNDSIKNDDEFTEEGAKFWSNRKYYDKLNKIAKVVISVGGWTPPDIVGVCEVENRYVLEGITKFSALKRIGYKIIHAESPDRRGIDVGFLYRPETFEPIDFNPIPVNFTDNSQRKTRDILHVSGKTKNNDTLNIFINHWPSRWGGQLESEEKRVFVASVLRKAVDSIFVNDKTPGIIIMGDLNDYPENKSLVETLKARREFSNPATKELYNLSWFLQDEKKLGTHKYSGEWGVLDQIIVSGDLLNPKSKITTSKENARVFNADFLLEKDETSVGYRPNRTYIGYRYHGGFSDHLPIFLDLFFNYTIGR